MTKRGHPYAWRCPYCHEGGREPSPEAARDAGVDHFTTVHDNQQETADHGR